MRLVWALLLASATACTSVKSDFHEKQPIQTYSSQNLTSLNEPPQCKAMLDSYCNYLYSPATQGNLEIARTKTPIKILQGDTANDFSQVYYRYAQAKLRSRNTLPADFRIALEGLRYFEKLRRYIGRPARARMSLQDRVDDQSASYELDYIWSSAFDQTLLTRIEKKYPGFHKLSEKSVPIELQLEQRRANRKLISEVSLAIWRGDKNWEKVEATFERLKTSYLDLIPRLAVPKSVSDDWLRRIKEVKLALPGSLPAVSDEECSATVANAFYYTYLDVITVCAGDFNSVDIMQTLAHEMGHALGFDRSTYLFEENSRFGRKLSSMRAQVCQPETFSCDSWSNYKKDFVETLSSLDDYRPDLPEFQQCLKRRPTTKSLTSPDIERFAESIVSDRISDLASSDRFLRITKPEIPMRNGKSQKNPNYLNPCSYYLWSHGEEPIHDELTTLAYFTAEYRCSDKPGPARMKDAIEVAKSMTEKLMAKVVAIEGEFSSRDRIETEGFSSPTNERFADVVGSYAMAGLLTQLPEKWDRRNVFLASSSWQCTEPSLATHFPAESAVENEYVFEAHTGGDQRKKEFFSAPIREAIGCVKDFDFKECQLPLKEKAQ